MYRKISFNDAGDIIIETATRKEVISSGLCLLTKEECERAKEHGWLRVSEQPDTKNKETDPDLWRVRKS